MTACLETPLRSNRPWVVVVGTALWVCATCLGQGTPSGRTFYATFEGSLDAADACGSKQGKALGKPAFAPGREGQGLVVGDVEGAAGVRYETQSNLRLDRGTIAMWVQPVNWQGDAGTCHVFLSAKMGEKGSFLFYKYTNISWGLTFYVHPDEGPRSKMYCYRPINEWQPGQWHHIACAWTHLEGMALYIDGEQVKHLAGIRFPDLALKPEMILGSDWQRKGRRTVIDELMIFGRMLAPHEIAQLAGRDCPPPDATKPRDVPGVMLTHAILGQSVLARVYRDALGRPPMERARLSLCPKKGGEPAASKTVALTDELTQLHLDLTPLPRDRYEARLELLSHDSAQAVESLLVPRETDDTWETAAKIGKDDTVLPPFTRLECTGSKVRCYGREYEFAGSALLSAARSQGQNLLRAPARLVASASTGPIAFTHGELKAIDASPTQARFTGSLRGGLLDVQTEAVARYDGTVWTTLRLHPKAAVSLKHLRVEIPVASNHAKYLAYIGLARIDDKRLGYDALPQGRGVVWTREFLPSVWLGTEERGLGWYAESDEHWDADGEAALTVERTGDTATLCMNIIRRPRTVSQPFTIAFGLQATPVRPLPPDWRSCQWAPSEDITRFFLHLRKRPYPRPEIAGKRPRGKVCYLYAYQPHFTSTLPKDPEEFRDMVQRVKDFGLLGTPYTDVNLLPETHGDMWLKGDAMRATPGARASSYGPVCNTAVCHRGPFADWFVWYVSHLVREYGANGVYIDEMWSYGCADAAHGCGYVGTDGKLKPTYPLRAQNEIYRRIRAVLAATGKPFHITYHISGGRLSPLATFGDSLLLGEDRYYYVRKSPDYTENMTAAQWRAGYVTPAWGIPVVFIPQFKMSPEWMKSEDLAAKLMAAAVPHDVMLWPVFANANTIMAARDVLDSFGIAQPDTRFLPYWREGTGVTATDARVKLSAYLRPGKVLLCPANWSSEPIEKLTIVLDLPCLKLPKAIEARDARTGEPVTVAGNRVTMAVPAKRLRLVEVRGR